MSTSNGTPPVRPQVLILLPSRPGENMAMELWKATQRENMGDNSFDVVGVIAQPCSLLNNNFNDLWCKSLNRRDEGITHVVMIHSDVCPEPGSWLQDLLAEQQRVDADVLSSVIALKDDTGMSSTGMMHWPSEQIKKLSVAECLALPTTFNSEDAYDLDDRHLAPDVVGRVSNRHDTAADYCLLLNTGLWICDFTQSWVEKVCFRSYDTILHNDSKPEGEKWRAVSTGEDWLFSMDCYRLGLRTFATTAVKVLHQGIFRYPNYAPFGTLRGQGEWGYPWCIQAPPSWAQTEATAPPLPRRPARVAVPRPPESSPTRQPATSSSESVRTVI